MYLFKTVFIYYIYHTLMYKAQYSTKNTFFQYNKLFVYKIKQLNQNLWIHIYVLFLGQQYHKKNISLSLSPLKKYKINNNKKNKCFRYRRCVYKVFACLFIKSFRSIKTCQKYIPNKIKLTFVFFNNII